MTGGEQPTRRVDLRLVPAAVTCWLVTAAGIVWPVGGAVAMVSAAVAGGAAVALWRGRRRDPDDRPRKVAAALLAVGVVGAGFGWAVALRSHAAQTHPLTASAGRVLEVTVTPSESPRLLDGGGRVMFRAALRRIGTDDAGGRVLVFATARDYADVASGRPVRFTARVGKPKRHDLSVAVLTATGKPTHGQASALQRAGEGVRRRFAEAARVLPGDQAAMLPALVLGDTSAVPEATTAEFRAAGLTHLTAVSGANVTIVCGAVLLVSRLIGPRAAVLLAGVALAGFVVVVQPSPSVLRAALVGAVGLLGIVAHRRRQAMPALAATVVVLMIAAPELAVDVGFALSVLATAGLVLVAPVWSRRLVDGGWPKWLADALCVATAAQLVTAPLIAGISGSLSLVSIVANLAVAAVIAPITVLGTAAAALCPLWPGGAELLIRFTGPPLWWLLRVAHDAGGLPGASVAVPSGSLGVAVVGIGTLLVVVAVRRLLAGRGAAGPVGLAGGLLLGWAVWSAVRGTIVA